MSSDVVFGWSPRRFAVTAAAVGFVASITGYLLAYLTLSAFNGRQGFSGILGGVAFIAVYTTSFPLFSLLLIRGQPPGLRFDSTGIELAAGGRDAVFVAYEAVSHARVRRGC